MDSLDMGFVPVLYCPPCQSGEIGRRTGFKIPRGQPHAGSIPASGTNERLRGYSLFAVNPFFV